jgi:hypothetical protein
LPPFTGIGKEKNDGISFNVQLCLRSTVVEHSAHNLKIEGLPLITINGRGKMMEKVVQLCPLSTVVEYSSHNPNPDREKIDRKIF